MVGTQCERHHHNHEINVNKLKDLVTGEASSAPVSQVAHVRLCCPLLVRGSNSPLSATASSTTSTDYSQRLVNLAAPSVEALASTLFPLTVHHYPDDDEEDAAQHGEEHGEENADAAHPLFHGTH